MNNRGKYVSFLLKKFCNGKEIVMEFILFYKPKQNSIVKQFWYILDTIKDAILVDSKLSSEFWAKVMVIVVYLKNLLLTSLKKRY